MRTASTSGSASPPRTSASSSSSDRRLDKLPPRIVLTREEVQGGARMPGLLADSGLTWADVLRTWNELTVPEGWRPEITPGGIVMTPPPSGAHNLIADEL